MRRGRPACVRRRARPPVRPRDPPHLGPDRVAFDVSHRNHRMRIVHWTRVKPPLPQVPAPAILSKGQTPRVIPAKAEIQCEGCGVMCSFWIPAFAGRTLFGDFLTNSAYRENAYAPRPGSTSLPAWASPRDGCGSASGSIPAPAPHAYRTAHAAAPSTRHGPHPQRTRPGGYPPLRDMVRQPRYDDARLSRHASRITEREGKNPANRWLWAC